MQFSTYAQQALGRRILRPGTVAEYQRLLAITDERLGAMPVDAIRRGHVQECLASASHAGLGAKSVRNLLALVSSVLREAGNTAAVGLRVKAPQPDLHTLNGAQAERLDAHLAELGTAEATALRVLLGTGLRRGEALALEVADWDREQQQVQVGKSLAGPTKSGRVRWVACPSNLVTIFLLLVKEARAAGRARLLPVHPRALGRALRRATDALGLPAIRVHDLRHTRITRQLLAGVPVLFVSEQAGHHSPSFTMERYGHLVTASPSQRREWADAS